MKTEEEQINQLKTWWKNNGSPVIVGVVIALAISGGWRFWQNYQAEEKAKAATIYGQVLDGFSNDKADVANTVEQLQTLINEHSNLEYVQYANLLLVKIALQNNNHDEAISLLQATLAKSKDAVFKDLVSIRLARVLADVGKYDEALQAISKDAQNNSYQALQNDVRGDIYHAKNDLAQARKHYQLAYKLSADDEILAGFNYFVQGKLDDLAVFASDNSVTARDLNENI